MIRTIVILCIINILLFSGCTSSTETTSSTQTISSTPSIPPEYQTTTLPPSTVPQSSTPVESTTVTTQLPSESPVATTQPTSEPYSVPLIFSASPTDLDKIDAIVMLGNLNPPSHTFPTDHIYFYPTRQPDADGPDVVNVYSPGDLTIIQIWASEHVNAGFADFNVIMQPYDTIRVMFYHVSTLNPAVFGDTSDFSSWYLDSEYTTGGEIYRLWTKDYDIEVKAGDLLGTAGGNPRQWAFDLGVWDENYYPPMVANPDRWEGMGYLHTLCPLVLYEPGPVLDAIIALVDRDEVEGEVLPCGSVMQDIPGTAQGIWFLEGITETYPEDPHLALVHSNIHPANAVLSVGNSVPGLPSYAYDFLPEDMGFLNRDFKDITPDGNIYGFQVYGFQGIIIISMPDSETLYIEALLGASTDPSSWSFTSNKVIFVR
jgi:hypothetical protein